MAIFPRTPNDDRRRGRSVASDATEFKDLLLAYVRQEALAPFKTLARFVLYGLLGAMLMSLGGFLVALGIVRAVQFEAGVHLQGDWSWVPYFGGVLFLLLCTGIAVTRIAKVPR